MPLGELEGRGGGGVSFPPPPNFRIKIRKRKKNRRVFFTVKSMASDLRIKIMPPTTPSIAGTTKLNHVFFIFY